MSKIVVGVDGSEASLEALRWAVKEARLRGSTVVAVHAWTFPVAVGPLTPVVIPDLDFESRGRKLLDDAVAGVASEGVVVEQLLVERSPAEALLRVATDADLLVVGSRGFGGFRGLLMGSVGHQCVQHATCPVVVIPHAERPAIAA